MSCRSLTHLLPVLVICLLQPGVLEGQHPAWQQFTVDDGLPSNDVYHLMQDSRGFLWVTTYQGICYFNGYEFRRPVDTSVMASSSAFHPWEDAQGRVWFSHLPGSLWLVENDTVRPWQHNAALSAQQQKYGYVGKFVAEPDGTLWIAIDRLGYLVVSPDGAQRIVLGLHHTALNFMEVNGKVLEVVETGAADLAAEARIRENGLTAQVYHWQDRQASPLGRFPLTDQGKGVSFRAWRLRNGDFLLCRLQTFYLIHNNQLIWHGQKDIYVEDILEDQDGAILLCSIAEGISGLLRFPSIRHFQRDEYENLLPGHEVYDILRDREGGWWASTHDAGLFYCKNPQLDIFDTSSGLPSAHVQRLTSDGRKTYAGLRPFDICAIPRFAGRPVLLPQPPGTAFKEMTALRFDTLTGRLWCGADLCFWENERWTFSDRNGGLSNHPENSISAQNITPDPNGKVWWADYRTAIAAVDRRTGQAVTYLRDQERLFSVTPDVDGKLWVTNLSGLRIWRNGQYEAPPFDHPALRYPLRGLELLPEQAGGGLVIRLRGGGLLIRDKDGQFTHLTRQDGLCSDVFTDLDLDAEGVIYACSNTGLNRLTHQANGAWRIEAITTKHGLPSNQVNDVALVGQELWVATDRGIARFPQRPAPAPMPTPQLERFRVNNRDAILTQQLRLAHDQNNIAIHFLAVHFRSSGDIPYRYRLLGADTAFSYTQSREVNFVALRPREYTFEVQAQNEDGQWSAPARYQFEIRPAWWNTAWFRALVAAGLIAGAWLFYQSRLRAARHESEMREKIRDLQTAALRAQMNPHFIFNCLASIQNFIAENDPAAATRYLARFARLVRLALHGSLDGTHALADEVEMLENYCSLEQLRFRGKFNFTVTVGPGLDPESIFLPPMLVQPFVENAILHGMKNKTEGGRISVVFSRQEKNLVVMVSDNGPGFKPEKNAETSGHKSVGMTLTQNRLSLLGGKDQDAGFDYAPIMGEDGQPEGTRVTVLIPLEETA